MALLVAAPLEGLGVDVATLERLCHEDADALVLLREATTGEHGGDRGNQHTGGKSDVIPLAGVDDRGTSRAYTVARLAADRPDLFARVKAGEVSAHAAAIAAGFRRPTMTVPCDPDGLARGTVMVGRRKPASMAAACADTSPAFTRSYRSGRSAARRATV